MNTNEANALVKNLSRVSRSGRKISVRVETKYERVAVRNYNGRMEWRMREGGRVVFQGGSHGEHSIDLTCSSPERVLAHFQGYCDANQMGRPVVGQLVDFPSASNWRCGGYRTGRVTRVGRTRVTVEYTFKHGGKATAEVRIDYLRV